MALQSEKYPKTGNKGMAREESVSKENVLELNLERKEREKERVLAFTLQVLCTSMNQGPHAILTATLFNMW